MRHKNTREQPKSVGSPKVEVGEIDTSAPFQSVKHAVSLFGEGALSGEKPTIKKVKLHSSEKVLAKDSQLHLAEKELKKLKERIKNAENTKAEALVELEKAMQTTELLNQKLKFSNEAKEAALKTTEATKVQAKQLEEENNGNLVLNNADQLHDLECAREQYMNVLEELNAAKQELTKVRQHYDVSIEAKNSASTQVEEAELTSGTCIERTQELYNEISALKETIEQVQQATMEAKKELATVSIQKEESSENMLQDMRRESDSGLIIHLETQLAEKIKEICTLQKELEDKKASDMETLRTVTLELESAQNSLQKLLKEENGLCRLVDSFKHELETLRKEHRELREKEAKIESDDRNLYVKLRKSKSELEICLTEEAKSRGASDEVITMLNQVSSETEIAQLEAEKLKIKAGELEKEAETTRASLNEIEELLKIALKEAEQAREAEEISLEKIKIISERSNTENSSTSNPGGKIILSREEFESLIKKAETSDKLTELKLAAVMAQEVAAKASENEAFKKLEMVQKEIDDINTATQEAVKKASSAEAAKKAVEGELRKWREKEQKKAAEIASRIMAETSQVTQKEPVKYSPIFHKVQMKKLEPSLMSETMEKQRSSVSKKTMMPSLSGIFQRKKSQIDTGLPSYLARESSF